MTAPVEPASVPVGTKRCQNPSCGAVFARKPTEGPSRWAARKFHAASCKSAALRAPVVETQEVSALSGARPMWRPAGFVLRPGDEGYGRHEQEDRGVAS